MRILVTVGCLLLPALLNAQQLEPAQDLRRQIAAQIGQAEADFADESHACASRFDVNTCLAEARARHKARIKPLQAREQALGDELRQSRVQAQRERASARKSEFASGETPRSAAKTTVAIPLPPQLPLSSEQVLHDQQAKAARDAQQALRNKEQLNSRQLQLEEQQRAARQRNQQQLKERKSPVAPLPLPGAADIAAAASAAPGRR